MTQVNANLMPTQLAMGADRAGPTSVGSIISSLANVSPAKVGAFADQAFLALGNEGVKFLPFLTALIKAFQGTGGPANADGAGAKGRPVDIGQATQDLLALRNANSDVANIDKAIGAISKALPALTQEQFDDLVKSVKTAAQVAGSAAAPGQTATIDATELGLINDLIAASKSANKDAAASPTGNAALDAVLSAIKDIAQGGVEPSERSSLAQVLASLVGALLPPDQADSVLRNLGGPSAPSGPVGVTPGFGVTIDIRPSIGTFDGGLGGGLGAGMTTGRPGAGMFDPVAGFYGGGSPLGGRGGSYDGMAFVLRDLYASAAQNGFDPLATNTQAYNMMLTALQDAASRVAGSRTQNQALNSTSLT